MIKLLLVDDNATIKSLIKLLLKDTSEIKIIGDCDDGDEVISFIKRNETDVILMDIMMKKVNGFEATKIVKSFNSKIKIIGLSSSDHQFYVTELLNAGADDFISKAEVTEELLLSKIKSVTRK